MFGLLLYVFEVKKELLAGLSLSILFITYYLLEAVKRPRLVCGSRPFRALLAARVSLLAERYWPTPWCVEARLQTVLGSLLRSRCLPPLRFSRQLLRLRDGGQVALDWLEEGEGEAAGDGDSRPVLLVLPGLTGAAHADYVRVVLSAARPLGARAVVFSNRGQGGVPLATPRLYCALSTQDLAEVVAGVKRRAPGPLLAVGVSLGGLILAHYLSQRGVEAALHVHAALVVSAPLDVERGADCMERPPLNALLSWHMARNLRRTVRAHPALEQLACDWRAVAASRSVRQFDAAFTARHFGFGSVGEYYRAATLRDKLHAVRVPLLFLCAADDPFQPERVLPEREAERAGRGGAPVALLVTARGGHIGFLEGWWPAARAERQYMARLTLQYFAALLEDHDPEPELEPKHRSSPYTRADAH